MFRSSLRSVPHDIRSAHDKREGRMALAVMTCLAGLATLAVGCSSPSGGGGGVVLTPCQTSTECSGYPCTNNYCDFSSYDAGTASDSTTLSDSTSVGDAATGLDSSEVDSGIVATDTALKQADTSAPIDGGCKTAQGKPCCTSADQCPAGSACSKASCDVKTGVCGLTTLANCCQKDSDCGGGASNPCKKGACDVATKACSVIDAANGDPCDDGDACTQKDNCVVGSCNGQPLDCDDGDLCTTDSCSNGTCKNQGISGCCAKGACCDLDKKTYRPAGSQCGTTPTTESRCKADGLGVETRFAFAVCGGASATCPTTASSSAWSAWVAVKTCTAKTSCVKVGAGFDCGPAAPSSSNSCTSGVCCDTAMGKIKGKGSQCSTSVYSSKRFCAGNNIFKAEGFRGCSGSSSTGCSWSSSHRYWKPATFSKACAMGQYCYAYSSTSAYCKTGSACSSGACCDVKGTAVQLPKYTKCDTLPAKTTMMCGEGNTVMKRQAFPGCTGSSSACSSSSSYFTWTPWTVVKTCSSSQACKMTGPTASCVAFVAPKQCSSGTCCDTKLGRYKPFKTKCGISSQYAQYTCAADFKKVLGRNAYAGCTGRSSSCSGSSTYRHYTAWMTTNTCSSNTFCKQTTSNSKPLCSTSPSKCSSGTCCSSKGYSTPKYTSCSGTVTSFQQKCDATGHRVFSRKATHGCSGSSSSCSSSSSYWSWSGWTLSSTCVADKHCVQSSSTGAACKSVGI